MTNMFISYKNWLKENDEAGNRVVSSVNKHMTHAEDLVVLGGEEGVKWIINMFKSLHEKLKGHTQTNNIKISIKFDGAPSVFVWTKFAELKKPGVAIKGLFAKNPKIMYTSEDVDNLYGQQPDLANKLKLLLKYVSKLGIPKEEIWQGDFLFDKNTLKEDDKQYAFHPNTIVYKIDKNSDLGKQIGKADIGIVWHTRYKGSSLENIEASYNTKVDELNSTSHIFMTDPYIASLAGIITLTDKENNEFNDKIDKIESTAQNLYQSESYNNIISNKDLIALFSTFQNSLIKRNITVNDSLEFKEVFINYLNEKYNKELETKKTANGKDAVKVKYNNYLEIIDTNDDAFESMLTLIIHITRLKNIFIKKLNNIGKFETYLQTNSNRFINTGQEGFAVSDITGNIVKLVDRYEFSYANFSPEIKKGWTK